MYERRFSRWHAWSDRDDVPGVAQPGVYVLTMSGPPADAPFQWSSRVVYVGMSNSRGGLRARLGQFDATMRGRLRHGGADRARLAFPDYELFVRRCRVAVAVFPCSPGICSPADLRQMGRVAQFEYQCLAHFLERFKKLPRFNDKPNAPKHSKRAGSSQAGIDG